MKEQIRWVPLLDAPVVYFKCYDQIYTTHLEQYNTLIAQIQEQISVRTDKMAPLNGPIYLSFYLAV